MIEEITLESNIIQNIDNYKLTLKKNGFHFIWNNIDDFKTIFKEKYNIRIDCIECHMKIWTKIFYDKHMNDKFNKSYKESIILKELPQRLFNIITNSNRIIKLDKENKLVLDEVTEINGKKINYRYVLKLFVKSNKLRLITLFRNK